MQWKLYKVKYNILSWKCSTFIVKSFPFRFSSDLNGEASWRWMILQSSTSATVRCLFSSSENKMNNFRGGTLEKALNFACYKVEEKMGNFHQVAFIRNILTTQITSFTCAVPHCLNLSFEWWIQGALETNFILWVATKKFDSPLFISFHAN